MSIMTAYFTGPGKAPNQAHTGDAGFDLAYFGDTNIYIHPNQTCNIPTGISIALPPGMWAAITGRSSAFKRDLLTPLSIIDNGYRGELFAIVRNIGPLTQEIMPGERIAQLIPMAVWADTLLWEHSATLDDTTRGTSGFGSTGRH